MKILKVIHGYPPLYSAGSEVYSQTLCNELVNQGHEVVVFTRQENAYAQEYSVDKEEDDIEEGRNVREEFLEYAEKTQIERIREQILEKMGITEEELERLPPEERAEIEEDIAEEIEKHVKGQSASAGESLGVLI